MAAVWVIVVVALTLLEFCFILWARRRYSRRIRRRLDSKQPACYSPSDLHVVTVLAGAPELHPLLPGLVQRLVQEVHAESGKDVYVGRVLAPWVVSEQFAEDVQSSMQVVMVTQWRSWRDFNTFKTSVLDGSSTWTLCWSTGFKRKPLVNFMLPCWLGSLQLMSCILRQRYDVQTPMTSPPTSGTAKKIYDSMTRRHVLEKVKGANPAEDAQPVLVWSWVKRGTPEQQKSEDAYSKKMMSMLSQWGAGVMDMGEVRHTVGETQDFDMVASVYYPSRGFVVTLSESQWMQDTVQGKQEGDTIALITVPFS